MKITVQLKPLAESWRAEIAVAGAGEPVTFEWSKDAAEATFEVEVAAPAAIA